MSCTKRNRIKQKNSASYNLTTVIFVISITDLVKNSLFRACYLKARENLLHFVIGAIVGF
jgi:hypothetical protein